MNDAVTRDFDINAYFFSKYRQVGNPAKIHTDTFTDGEE